MKIKLLQSIILSGAMVILFICFGGHAQIAKADTYPYNVPSSISSGWSQTYGSKSYSMTSGKDLVYDVYDNKYLSNGYTIEYHDFGKGNQPYLHFDGWSVLFGYHNQDESNSSSYIVAKKVAGSSGVGSVKIYNNHVIHIDATEDLEYNNQGSGVYNPCSDSEYNKVNTTCNMTYTTVGFGAYIPLQDLFPNQYEYGVKWSLYLVKNVMGHIVYTQLILPFDFGSRSYNNGKLGLDSGINANKLTMNSPGVMRRSYPREDTQSVVDELGSNRYFTQGTTYTRVDSEESKTAVWYGVKTSDSPSTRWAATSYWTFGGDQAVVSYDAPPKYISSSVTGNQYTNGSTYWVRPGTNVTLHLTGADYDTGIQTIHTSMVGSGDEARAGYDFDGSSQPGAWQTWVNWSFVSASGTSIDSSTKEANITMKAGSNDSTGDFQYWIEDNANNTTDGYHSTGKSVKIDADNPIVQFRNGIDTANYTSQSWTTSTIQVRLKFSDSLSGYKQSRYEWTQSTSTPGTWSSWTGSPDYVVSQSSYGAWYLHVQAQDNVGNTVTTYAGPYEFNHAPTVDFTDSPNPTNRLTNVCFANKSSDPDGNGMSYVWVWKMSTASTWNILSYSQNPCYKFPQVGTVDVKLTTTDSHGASGTATHTVTVNDVAPNAGFTASPNPTDRLTTVQFTSTAKDPENDPITFKYYYRIKGTTTWTQFSTSTNPTYKFPTVNTYDVEQVVTDSYGKTASAIVDLVVNDIAPKAGFTATPNPTDRLSAVQFKSTATDAENDPLTYSYVYRVKGTSTWTQMSTSANPTFKFSTVNTFEVQQTATDNYGKSASTIVDVKVNDLAPTANFVTDKTFYYIMDNVKITDQSTDPENDTLTYKFTVTAPDGSVTNNTSASFTFRATQVGNYTVNLVVTDPYGKSDSMTKIIPINDLTLIGHVGHTSEWTSRHQSFGDTPDEFYSGERFELSADVTDYPISYVKVTLTAPQVDGNTFNKTVDLSENNSTSWVGEMYDPSMADIGTRLTNGDITFHFEALYQNGAIKTNDVTVKIIGSMLDAFKLHRWY